MCLCAAAVLARIAAKCSHSRREGWRLGEIMCKRGKKRERQRRRGGEGKREGDRKGERELAPTAMIDQIFLIGT